MGAPAGVWAASLAAVGVASAIPLLATLWLASRPARTAAWVPRLILLAAGALLGAALFHLLPAALASAPAGRAWAIVAAGVAAMALLERAVHALERPAEASAHAPQLHRGHLMPLGIATDALHNAIDGALVASAYMADPSLGIMAGVAIALHELPRELGTYALCVDGGLAPRTAVLLNAATGGLALLGAAAALAIGGASPVLGTRLVPFAAGNFLYLSLAILVTQRRNAAAGPPLQRVALVAAGVAVTAVIAGQH